MHDRLSSAVNEPLVAQELGMIASHQPALIVLGGFPGSGKTTMTRRLACDWHLPRLASDMLGQTISASEALQGSGINAYWIAYEVLFALCAEFLRSGLSVVLDLTLGWAFHWRELDALTDQNPAVLLVPIILHCPRDLCLERTQQRYVENPTQYDAPDVYRTDPKILAAGDYLDALDRPDIHRIDASRSADAVYRDVSHYLAMRLSMTS